jgi:AcrR family transcriptional regulator
MTDGLRERKKAKTRWAIQEHALRLFAEQGYAATTVDQIAAAAEISPSTFFRYFPTKEDVVVQDEYDDLFVVAFREAAAADDPVVALRATLRGALGSMPEEEWALSSQRAALVLGEPALRARSVDNFVAVAGKCRAAIAEGAGRADDDPGVTALVGAFMGVLLSVAVAVAEAGGLDQLLERIDAALARLEGVDWFRTRA